MRPILSGEAHRCRSESSRRDTRTASDDRCRLGCMSQRRAIIHRDMSAIPASSRWVFWDADADADAVDLERDANGVLARVLERGGLDEVKWLIETYGLERIRTFFREVWAPEISERTRGFWRALFEAET